jgi:hypothetical protein
VLAAFACLLPLASLAPVSASAAAPRPVQAAVASAPTALAAPVAEDSGDRADNIFDYPRSRLGAFVALDEHNGFKERKAHLGFERKWKRPSDFIREFVEWDEPTLFTKAQRRLAADGREIILSWNSYEHSGGVRWEDVVSGAHDELIDARAEEIIDFGHPIAFTFQHEPDNQIDQPDRRRAGTPEDFCNAYRYVLDRFDAAGVTNATYGIILMAWTPARGHGDRYFCGEDYVEFLGVDGFNWFGCQHPVGPWRMPRQIFTDWYEWASTSYDLPLVIAEWGTGEDPDDRGRKADWITEFGEMVKDWPEVKAALIFNSGRNPGCERYSDTSRSSQRAFIKLGADPYFAPAERAPADRSSTIR